MEKLLFEGVYLLHDMRRCLDQYDVRAYAFRFEQLVPLLMELRPEYERCHPAGGLIENPWAERLQAVQADCAVFPGDPAILADVQVDLFLFLQQRALLETDLVSLANTILTVGS